MRLVRIIVNVLVLLTSPVWILYAVYEDEQFKDFFITGKRSMLYPDIL